MATSSEAWQMIHHLAQHFDTNFPTKARLRLLAEELTKQRPQTRELTQRDAEYVLCSMDELVSLIRATSEIDTSRNERSENGK